MNANCNYNNSRQPNFTYMFNHVQVIFIRETVKKKVYSSLAGGKF